MLSFHNDQNIKDKYIARLQSHAAADEIIKGKYWENGMGCGIGCTIHGNEHSAYEDELGIPRLLAKLEDGIFEGLPNDIAKGFPLRFLSAVPVGVDLNTAMVFEKFMHWLLVDQAYGVIQYGNQRGKLAIQAVADLYQRKINGEHIECSAWRDAAAAAYAAANAAAYAAYAAANAAAYAAYAAANAAADAAANAAAYADAAYAAARQKHRVAQADKLIELLTNSGE